MNVGWIGLGIMGSRMATNLLRAGHNLIIYNRTQVKAESLIQQGAVWAATPQTIAEQHVDVLVTMVSTPQAVEELALREQGFLAHLSSQTLWVDCTTVNPSFSRRMAEEARQRGIRFLDAPVAGTKGPAEQGQLLFLVGGDKADVQECQPLFDVMGRKVIHVGECGKGSSLKMVLNLLLGQAMFAFSEAMILGQSLGIGREMLFDVLSGSPVVAPFLTSKREKIEAGKYEADFPLQWMQKDLQLAAATAYEQGIALPSVSAMKEMFALAKLYGYGKEDFSAIYDFLKGKG